MSRTIKCSRCDTKVLSVKVASVRKDIVCYCGPCNNTMNKQIASLQSQLTILTEAKSNETPNYEDIFGDMFKGFKND